jgi:2-iminobutanoate/2-iminopropanoate deaminase
MTERQPVRAADAPAAIGPYTHAIRHGRTCWTSGQVGLVPASGELVAADVGLQTRQALANLSAVLAAAGCGLGDVVKTTVFLVDMADFASMNAVYAEHFGTPYPARSTVAVAALPKGARVEIEAVAVLPSA